MAAKANPALTSTARARNLHAPLVDRLAALGRILAPDKPGLAQRHPDHAPLVRPRLGVRINDRVFRLRNPGQSARCHRCLFWLPAGAVFGLAHPARNQPFGSPQRRWQSDLVSLKWLLAVADSGRGVRTRNVQAAVLPWLFAHALCVAASGRQHLCIYHHRPFVPKGARQERGATQRSLGSHPRHVLWRRAKPQPVWRRPQDV